MKLRLTLLAALAATPLAAQGIEDWDTDGDRVLGESEFTEGVFDAGVFEEWDADANGEIGYPELSDGLYGTWDANDDGELSVDEWDNAVDLWFGEFDVNLNVDNWDTDGNGVISRSEFASALEGTDLVARLGGEEGSLNEEQLSAGLFDIADTDDDDLIAEEEDGFFTDVTEFFTDEEEPAVGDTDEIDDVEDPRLIERGEAFMQLPIPCGEGSSACEDTAARFCAALGYGTPLDILDVSGQLYVIRCEDGI